MLHMIKQNRKDRNILSKKRKDEIAEYVDMVLETYPFTANALDWAALCEKEDILVKFESFPETFDGLIVYDQRFFTIIVNASRMVEIPQARVNFTICHELGHYFLPEHRQHLKLNGMMQLGDSMKDSRKTLHEREADYFASCLLMPADKIAADFAEEPFSYRLIQHVAGRYNVSREACFMRYMSLGPDHIMMVYSKEGKLSLPAYPRKSRHFPFSRPILDEEGRLPEPCLASEKNYPTLVEDYYILSHPTSSIFNVNEDQDVVPTIYEYCMPLAEKGKFLSVFYF